MIQEETKTAPKLPAARISPPWFEYESKLSALFAQDPEVHIDSALDGTEKKITLRVDDAAKAAALKKLLPASVCFGGVEVTIAVVPANGEEAVKSVVRTAFAGNPAFVCALEAGDGVFSPKLTYGMFAPDVAQFWNDNLGNPDGISSYLYESIAKDVFGGGKYANRIFWTTASKE